MDNLAARINDQYLFLILNDNFT